MLTFFKFLNILAENKIICMLYVCGDKLGNVLKQNALEIY